MNYDLQLRLLERTPALAVTQRRRSGTAFGQLQPDAVPGLCYDNGFRATEACRLQDTTD